MNETKNPFDVLLEQFRQVVREEIRKELLTALKNGTSKGGWVPAKELAAKYHLPRTWFEERGRQGTLSTTKPGRYVLFYEPDVDRYFREHTKGEMKDS